MKKKEFLYIARLLNEKLHIVPLLFGSLGLEQRLQTNLNADDIDVLIPKAFLSEKWESIVAIMNDNGYILYDSHEHAFEKSGLSFAFASIESLTPFAGIDLAKIPVIEEAGVRYYLLDLQDYLKVYTASSKDGYRKNVRNKKDEQKIELISKALGKQEEKGNFIMDALELIKTRRSTRKFQERAVEKELLDTIIEAGRHAPSGGNSQTTHFFVITDRAVLAELAALVKNEFSQM